MYEETEIRKNTQLVRKCIRPYFLKGGDYDDLFQEGMLGLLAALRSYDKAKGDNFQAYAALCIKRRVIDAIRRDNAGVGQRTEPRGDTGELLEAAQRTQELDDPEMKLLSDEAAGEIRTMLAGSASRFEAAVLDGFLAGKTSSEIAAELGRGRKSVDNAIRRIRRKTASYLSDRR